jgi:uncharacterized membrane protein
MDLAENPGGEIMTFDRLLLYTHILAAISWMGAGLTLVVLSIRARQVGEELKMIGQMEWLGPRIGFPSVIVMLGSGVWMVARSGAWQFSQLWIILAIALFIVLFLIGAGFHGPHYKRIRTAVEQHGDESPEVRRLVRGSFLAARIEVVLLAIAVWLMVAKPF